MGASVNSPQKRPPKVTEIWGFGGLFLGKFFWLGGNLRRHPISILHTLPSTAAAVALQYSTNTTYVLCYTLSTISNTRDAGRQYCSRGLAVAMAADRQSWRPQYWRPASLLFGISYEFFFGIPIFFLHFFGI